ncbi:MAG: hypothetical protein ACXAC7_08635 [Candidatus Hodarchaeales archaeon]|jgi:hypothetical protein
MISEERLFCHFCKRPSSNSPCSECQIIISQYKPPPFWNLRKLGRYTELLFNKDYYQIANVLIVKDQGNGLSFQQIHDNVATKYNQHRVSQLLDDLMDLGYCHQPIPNRYKFKS